MEPDSVEIRVLGCLVEKQRTTPDVYPLSLNALRTACNQSTNREPVVDYDDEAVGDAILGLRDKKFAVMITGNGRVNKYAQRISETLNLGRLRMAAKGLARADAPGATDGAPPVILAEATAAIEQQYLRKALKKTRGNVGNCAKMAGLSRRSVTAKLAEYKLDRLSFKDEG